MSHPSGGAAGEALFCTRPRGSQTAGRGEPNDGIISVEMVNSRQSDPELVCAQVYRTVETTIPLGSRFEPGATYTVQVNDAATTFGAGTMEQ